MNKKQKQILRHAIDKFSIVKQMFKAVEELQELQTELIHIYTKDTVVAHYPINNEVKARFTDEIADVYIMLEQLEMIFKNKVQVNKKINEKIERLKKIVEVKE